MSCTFKLIHRRIRQHFRWLQRLQLPFLSQMPAGVGEKAHPELIVFETK